MIWSALSARPTWPEICLKTSSATWSRRSRRRPPTAEPRGTSRAAHSSVPIHGYPFWGSHGHPHRGTSIAPVISSVDGNSAVRREAAHDHRRTHYLPHHL